MREVDVVVAGTGPAAIAAALELTQHGLSPVLVGPRASAGGAYDVIINEAALRTLDHLHIEIPSEPIETIELRLGVGRGHALPDASAAACDNWLFLDALRKAVADAGVEWWPERVDDFAISDGDDRHRIIIDGRTVLARHVIDATGSRIGEGKVGRWGEHGRVCVQRLAGLDLDRLVLTLPAPHTIDPNEKPVCFWVTQGASPGTFTIGAACTDQTSPQDLLREARSALAADDPRIAAARPQAPAEYGVFDSSFAPAAAIAGGRLLAGDAAGLVNPFTGEGLSYAMHSGLLAAQAIAGHHDDPQAAARSYKRKLSRTFVGYFETARHAAQRYHLAWRVLTATADSDRPVFAKVRRAVLLPEGFPGLTASEQMDLDISDLAVLAPFLLACDEVAISVVRTEWPFLARLLVAGENGPGQRLRPASPFVGALWATGRPPDVSRAVVAAAIELATLGALTFLGPMPQQPQPGRPVDWSLTSSVLAGDFLLGQATQLVADAEPGLSWAFADWLAELAALRSARVHPGQSSPAGAVFASLLEFPARIGGQLGGAPRKTVQALRTFGEQCGYVFLHAEDVLAVTGRRTRLDVDLQSMLDGKLSAIPDQVSDSLSGPEWRVQAGQAARTAGNEAYADALAALEDVPHRPATRILRGFLDAVAAPLLTATATDHSSAL